MTSLLIEPKAQCVNMAHTEESFMSNTTGRRLAGALLSYIILVILLLTWNPFFIALPQNLTFSVRIGPHDALANVLLFLPLGFLFRLGQGRRRGAILLGAALSGLIEAGQFFIPGRTPSVVDLGMNTLGSWMGAMLHDVLTARIAMTRRMVGQLALEVPLMGLLYLLMPLLWVNRLVPGDATTRWLLTDLIGLCGAIILGDVFREWWGPVDLQSLWRVALAIGIWFLVGIGRSLTLQPLLGLASLTGISTFAAIRATIRKKTANRRFERATLNRLLPFFIIYLLLQALWPFSQALGTWHASFGLAGSQSQEAIRVNIRLIEHLAAFTVLGYIAAEWRGRAELSWERDLPQLLLLSILCALILEILLGFQAGSGASLLRLVIATGGALFGGVLYHLQRDHVRFLLGHATFDRS